MVHAMDNMGNVWYSHLSQKDVVCADIWVGYKLEKKV